MWMYWARRTWPPYTMLQGMPLRAQHWTVTSLLGSPFRPQRYWFPRVIINWQKVPWSCKVDPISKLITAKPPQEELDEAAEEAALDDEDDDEELPTIEEGQELVEVETEDLENLGRSNIHFYITCMCLLRGLLKYRWSCNPTATLMELFQLLRLRNQ